MREKIRAMIQGCLPVVLLALLYACVPASSQPAEETAGHQPQQKATASEQQQSTVETAMAESPQDMQLPVRFQRPAYRLKEVITPATAIEEGDIAVPVGADISSKTPVSLIDILKQLTSLKGMNVSWESDVDQNVMVDVDIRAEDDFYKAIDNILRQKDYSFVAQDNTIVVKYKVAKKFYIGMPPRLTSSVSSTSTALSSTSSADIWTDIIANVEKVLGMWSSAQATTPAASTAAATTTAQTTTGQTTGQTSQAQTTPSIPATSPEGYYYTVDKSIGLITVYASRPLLEKISFYIDNLTSLLYKQIAIEAKIVEVELTDNKSTGIDWSSLLSSLNVSLQLFEDGEIYPAHNRAISKVSLPTADFSLVLNALQTLGDMRIISNPKVSVMNGQSAMIYVGDDETYVSQVTTTVSDTGTVTQTPTSAVASSGVRLEVNPTLLGEDEVLLSLIPTVTGVDSIEYKDYGTSSIGLPTTKLQEVNSIVRVKDGEMLVIGGLIKSIDDFDNKKFPVLGDIPGLKFFFNSKTDDKTKTELVVLLKIKIVS